MSWRGFFVVAALLGAIIVNAALIVFERHATPEEVAEVVDARKDRLLGIAFTPGTRIKNCKDFGFNDSLAEAVAQRTGKLEHRYKEKFKEKLVEYADEVGWALCGGSADTLPQRYAALSFLVEEENGKRKPIDVASLNYFEEREWWAATSATIEDLYVEFERSKNTKEDSTVMGVSAILLSREAEALAREAPWGRGGLQGRWSYEKLSSDEPAVEGRLVEYFALMHLLTEIANDTGGICQ